MESIFVKLLQIKFTCFLESLPISCQVFFPRLSSETEFQGLLPHAGFFFVYTHFNTAETFPRTSFQREAGVNLQIASGSLPLAICN